MTQDEIIRMARENYEVPCKDHPDAPHGFCRDASHSYDRYVCECEFWEPEENKIYTQAELNSAVLAEREACAKVCDDYAAELDQNKSYWDAAAMNCAAAIRARNENASS